MLTKSSSFTAVLLTASMVLHAQAAGLTPLGDLPTGAFMSEAQGVSGDGSVVVGYSYIRFGSDRYHPQAVRWTAGGGMVGLVNRPDYMNGFAQGASADGSVVVGGGNTQVGPEAFRWTSGGGMVPLGPRQQDGFFSSAANDVSGDGSVVVGSGSNNSGLEAFRWTSDGGMVGLGNLPGGYFQSAASGVSDDGSVVVGNTNSSAGFQAFRWTSGSGMVGLGDLAGGRSDSSASAASADGSVVVGYGNSASGIEAFRWTDGSGMVGLGDLPGGPFGSHALGVSADGAVVVGIGNQDETLNVGEAFLWTRSGGMQRLWDVLQAQGVDPAPLGWTRLDRANGISLDGSTIVGTGLRNGNYEAFIATITVPEPAGAALLAIAGLALLARRRPPASAARRDLERTERCVMKARLAFLPVLGLIAIAPGRASAAYTFTTVDPPGSRFAQVRGVSGGTVVGVYDDDFFQSHGYYYDGSTFRDLDHPGALYTVPNGVSGNTVVGATYGDFSDRGDHGFVYDGSTFTTLRYPDAAATSAEGVSGGTVVGTYRDDADAAHGFVYDGSTFRTLDVPGASYTYASGISGGTVVGTYGNSREHGFIYDGSTFTTLDFPGAIHTQAEGVSGGIVVGTYVGADHSNNSFIYDGSTCTTLNVPPSWGDVTFALDISGNTVVGWYSTLDDFGTIYPDLTHGFSVQVPEPAGALLVAIAGLGMLARRRSRP